VTGAKPLNYAASWGLNEVVKFLIVERSQDVNARGFTRGEDTTPLILASGRGHSEVVRTLLEHGADTETRDRGDWSPLDKGSQGGFVEVIRVLLEHGADVKALDKRKYTALHVAASWEQSASVRMLLEHGANPNIEVRAN
jgi:ankyrin repeat protein